MQGAAFWLLVIAALLLVSPRSESMPHRDFCKYEQKSEFCE